MSIGRTTFAVVISLLMLLGGLSPESGAAAQRAVGDTRVFARVPEPGQPGGIVVDRRAVHVTTLGVLHHPVTDPKIFTFGVNGRLRRDHAVPRDMVVSAMALAGAAVDRRGDLFVVDMNGRILRLDRRTAREGVYATFPASMGGLATMPFDLVFDTNGDAYVTDQNLAAIWRVGRGGSPVELWFQDPRMASYLVGPSGITMDPESRTLYFTVATSAHPSTAGQGLVFRLPLDNPGSSTLEEVARYPARSNAFDVVLGESGRLYVALAAAGQISILERDGTEALRFPAPEENAKRDVPFDYPAGLAFDGRGSLLVSNSSFFRNNTANMAILEVFVGDVSARLPRPLIPR